MSWEIFFDVLKNSLMITGLVVVMMMMIEYINVQSSGKWFSKLKSSKPRQVLLGSLLGLIPGCIGGFAAVSLYSHRLISFGALIAMMICSSGDEAFVLMAMIPKEAIILFVILFSISIIAGLVVDAFYKGGPIDVECNNEFDIHKSDHNHLKSIFHLSTYKVLKHPTKERIIISLSLLLFILAIFFGIFEHDHAAHIGHQCVEHSHNGNLDIFSERWLNIIFAILSVITLMLTLSSDEHFIKEHIWGHVIKHHCLKIFLWTFGALAVIQIGLPYLDIEHWIKDNTFYVIVLAALIGMIPESGPHMIFITLFAGGYVPFSVLLASSISQDGHTTLPLLASNKRSFVKAKLLNAVISIIVGSIIMFLGF